MIRPALAVALPAFGLAWFLAQTDVHRRAEASGFLRAATSGQGVKPIASVSPATVRAQNVLAPETYAVEADAGGQYETTMLVGGRELPALIDTGATFITLRYEDAASIGIHPVGADFKYQVQTANGASRVAATTLASVRVGNVEAHNVPALVSPPGLLTGRSLLGMSFLKRLEGWEVHGDHVILRGAAP